MRHKLCIVSVDVDTLPIFEAAIFGNWNCLNTPLAEYAIYVVRIYGEANVSWLKFEFLFQLEKMLLPRDASSLKLKNLSTLVNL